MNPLPILRATIRRHWAYFALFATIIAVAVALGVVLSAEERSFRVSSARAADKFDVLIAAPGSQTDVVMSAIYLRPGTVPLLSATVLAAALHDKDSRFAAPIAFGDNHDGAPIVGTIAAFIDHLSGGLGEGRAFQAESEAVVGAASPLMLGQSFKPAHGMEHHATGDAETDADEHDFTITVVGRMKPTGTPWDRAIAVPVEQVWRTHSLPAGHAPGDTRVGPPFDDQYLSGVPAVVMRPESVIAAYRLRAKFKTADSMSFFPAEVLVQLYGVLAQVQTLVTSLRSRPMRWFCSRCWAACSRSCRSTPSVCGASRAWRAARLCHALRLELCGVDHHRRHRFWRRSWGCRIVVCGAIHCTGDGHCLTRWNWMA